MQPNLTIVIEGSNRFDGMLREPSQNEVHHNVLCHYDLFDFEGSLVGTLTEFTTGSHRVSHYCGKHTYTYPVHSFIIKPLNNA